MNGMSEICIDCVHQEVCRYECYCPSGHCNDYAVADDFRPQGKWNIEHDWVHCSSCGHEQNYPSNFCPNRGADMRSVDKGLQERAISDLYTAIEDTYKKLGVEE